MSAMLAVRYMTLAVLVVWLGGMVTLGLLTTSSADQLWQFQRIGLVCGAILFACLIVIKFVGPPPHDFFPRIGLVAAMLAVTLYAVVRPQTSRIAMTVNIALGSVLLFWYARE
jgi:hypothetical protein